MRNIKMTIEYEGTNFYGWQKQNSLRTVQGVLEEQILKLTGKACDVEGSGRTDRGVHALGQVAHVKTDCNIPIENFAIALNHILPSDVVITEAVEVKDDFHARYSAKRKTYMYVVQCGGQRFAINNSLIALYRDEVDFEKMQEVAALLVGEHEFSGFCSAECTVKNRIRTIFDLQVTKSGSKYTILVEGNGFLHNMVRIIAGTLLDVGAGKLKMEDVKKALQSGERQYAGQTMPACGLYLKSVNYPKN